jgi:hypothetical protein
MCCYISHFVKPDVYNQTTHTVFLTNYELNKSQTHVIIRFFILYGLGARIFPCVSAKTAEFFILL